MEYVFPAKGQESIHTQKEKYVDSKTKIRLEGKHN
jgi:hypothetical protein